MKTFRELPAVVVILASEGAAGASACRVVDGVLCRAEAGRFPLSAIEWAAVKHLEARAARVNARPGLARLGVVVELSPMLRAAL